VSECKSLVGGVREGVAHAPKLKDAQEGCAGAVTGQPYTPPNMIGLVYHQVKLQPGV